MNKDNCYKRLGQANHIPKYFWDNYLNFNYTNYHGFSIHEVSLELVLNEPILQNINKLHKIKHAGIIKLLPNRCYKWHQDLLRGVCINMLLYHQGSFVLFGNRVLDSEDQYDTLRLDYNINDLYLFNNQITHTVINFSDTRYLFSVEFEENKNSLTYNNFYG
jgi:hypothetical protein